MINRDAYLPKFHPLLDQLIAALMDTKPLHRKIFHLPRLASEQEIMGLLRQLCQDNALVYTDPIPGPFGGLHAISAIRNYVYEAGSLKFRLDFNVDYWTQKATHQDPEDR